MRRLSASEMGAVLELLRDRSDPEVRSMLEEQLLGLDRAALAALRVRAAGDNDEAVMAIEGVLHRKIWEEVGTELRQLGLRRPGRLAELLVVLCRFRQLDCRPDLIHGQLEALAGAGARRVPRDGVAQARARALVEFLGEEEGFRGFEEDARWDPRHCFLDSVLRRRVGGTGVLAAVYVIVGERLGVPLRAIDLGGHFVVGMVEWNEKTRYFDPFEGGRRLRRVDCVRLVEACGEQFAEEQLRPVSGRRLVLGILRELGEVYRRRGERRCGEQITRYTGILERGEGSGAWRQRVAE